MRERNAREAAHTCQEQCRTASERRGGCRVSRSSAAANDNGETDSVFCAISVAAYTWPTTLSRPCDSTTAGAGKCFSQRQARVQNCAGRAASARFFAQQLRFDGQCGHALLSAASRWQQQSAASGPHWQHPSRAAATFPARTARIANTLSGARSRIIEVR